jgi:hypothetical protein
VTFEAGAARVHVEGGTIRLEAPCPLVLSVAEARRLFVAMSAAVSEPQESVLC